MIVQCTMCATVEPFTFLVLPTVQSVSRNHEKRLLKFSAIIAWQQLDVFLRKREQIATAGVGNFEHRR